MTDRIVVSPHLLQQCIGDSLATLDMLILTSEPADDVHLAMRDAYPSCPGQLEVLSFSQIVDFAPLEHRRWPVVFLLRTGQIDDLSIDIDKPQLTRLLAKLRDLHADRVIHMENDSHCWSMADSLALGFSQRETAIDQSCSLQIYEFDIRTYKPAPDWLNAKNWANPELWGKHRW